MIGREHGIPKRKENLTIIVGAPEVHDALDSAIVAAGLSLQLDSRPQTRRELCSANEPKARWKSLIKKKIKSCYSIMIVSTLKATCDTSFIALFLKVHFCIF